MGGDTFAACYGERLWERRDRLYAAVDACTNLVSSLCFMMGNNPQSVNVNSIAPTLVCEQEGGRGKGGKLYNNCGSSHENCPLYTMCGDVDRQPDQINILCGHRPRVAGNKI